MNRPLDHALALLQKARDDAWMFKELLKHPDTPRWGLGFHAQQASEKAIKAVLTSRGIKYPFTHDLQTILNLLGENGLPPPPRAAELPLLSPFGALYRYDAIVEILPEELPAPAWLETCVSDLLAWAEALVRVSNIATDISAPP